MDTHYRVLIECADGKGLIHAVSGVLLRHGLNIERNNEFVEPVAQRFFMRTEVSGPLDPSGLAGELAEVLPPEARVIVRPPRRPRVVVLVTREHHCLGDLLLRHRYKELDFELAAVLGNHDALHDLAEAFGVPFHTVSHEGLSRAEHEAAMLEVLEPYRPDYLVLAKYMRILTPGFVARYAQRMVNIHHSFLPAFSGAQPYRQAYRRGVKIIGATAHFVSDDLDEGPIIAQGVLPVDHTHDAGEMARAGRDIEKQVLSRALRLVFDDRVFVHGNRTIIFDA